MNPWNSAYLLHLRARPGFVDSIRRASTQTFGPWIFRIVIPWRRTAPHYWSADTLDTTLIGRLARLRGVGDAYYDYRGELRYFSVKTKTDILRAMGCAVDDPKALAAEVSQTEVARW